MSRLKQVAPYLIAAIALAWVFTHTDRKQFVDALARAPLGWFIAMSAVMVLINCAADTFAMSRVFAWFGCHVPYRDLYLVRGATYLLAVLNYHVGQAAIVGYLYRARRVPFFEATGWILFIIGINVGTLFLLATAGASQATNELAMLRQIPLICGVGVIVYSAILLLKPRVISERALFRPLFQMGILGHIKGVAVRLPHIFVLLLWHYIALRMFDINVPVLKALVFLPAYFAISSLPINVNGLGVAQLVAVAFFAQFAQVPADASALDLRKIQSAQVMAYSISTQGLSILLQLLLGFVCLRIGARRGLSQPTDVPLDPAEVSR